MKQSTALVFAAIATVGAAVVTTGTTPLAAQDQVDLDRDQEVRLAMSAGPLAISQEADVYVFGGHGFTKEVEGTNGYACMVIRSAANPDALAPHCFSPDATESVLPAKLEEGRLIAAGGTQEQVSEALMRDFNDGSLPLPSGNAYAYMLSSGQRLGAAGRWKPHFMLYIPYATNEDVGGVPGSPAFPFVGPEVNHPHSTMVIVMTEFVDPADVVMRQ
jgi:hypothetical protein